MRNYRLYILTAVLLGLVAITYWLLDQEQSPSSVIPAVNFGIPATAQPDSIVLERQKSTNFLLLKRQHLLFNGRYEVKPSLQEAFFVILKQMEAKRPVSKKIRANILAAMDSAGVKVSVYEKDNLIKDFKVWGDKENERTYIKSEKDNIYLITIPGYSTYIGGIFFYGEKEWRNNALFESTWRSLKKLDVQFPKDPSQNVSIEFGTEFFFLPGLDAFDTVGVLDYLEGFSNVRVIKYLNQEQQEVERLLTIEPNLLVKIEDLDTAQSNVLRFYLADSLINQDMVLVVGKEREMALISGRSFEQIAKEESNFSYTGTKK